MILVVFAPQGGIAILGAGFIGGLVHALIVYRREKAAHK